MQLLDTSAWVEYFLKSEMGRKVKRLLETQACYTAVISIAELSQWAVKNSRDGRQLIRYVAELSEILPLSGKIAFLAGELNATRKKKIRKWGMVDSIILATAQLYTLRIVTKDKDFGDLPDVDVL